MKNNTPRITPRTYINITILFHTIFTLAVLLFGAFVYFTVSDPKMNLFDSEDIFFYILPSIVIANILISSIIYKRKLTSLKQEKHLKTKMHMYQSARMIRYAFLEGSAFLACIVFMNTENLFYIMIACVPLLYFIALRPTKTSIINDLNLTREQHIQFQKSDEIIE